MADESYVIDDPNDPRLANTPLNAEFDPQAYYESGGASVTTATPPPKQEAPDTASGFDPETYIKTKGDQVVAQKPAAPPPASPGGTPVPNPQDLPYLKSQSQTFYYPSTPEDQVAHGLSPKMEGGPYGAGKFSNLELKNHTIEKFLAHESPWVAVAMKGVPTGEEFRTDAIFNGKGVPIIAKRVDTGGGLKDGQFDFATSDPQQAKTGGSGFDPKTYADTNGAHVVPDIHAYLEPAPADTPEAEAKDEPTPAEIAGGAISKAASKYGAALRDIPKLEFTKPKFELTPIPQVPQQQMQVIPGQGMIGAAIPSALPTPGAQLPQVTQGVSPMLPMSPAQQSRTGQVGYEPNVMTAGTEPTKMSEALRANIQPMLEHPISSFTGMLTNWDDVARLYRRPEDLLGPRAKRALGMPVSPEEEVGSQNFYNTAVGAAMAAPGVPHISEGAAPILNAAGRSLTGANMLPRAQQLAGIGITGGGREVPVPASWQPKGLPVKAASVQGLKNPPRTIQQMKSDVADLKNQGRHAEAKALQGQVNQMEGLSVGPNTGQPPTPPSGGGVPQPLNPVADRGPFWRSYKLDKELGEHMDAIGAAPETGALMSEYASRNLLHELNPQQEAALGKLLVSDRLREVNPQHPQVISDAEARAIESDPAIKKALDYYAKEIKPEIEALRKRAGLTEKAAAGKSATFVSLIPERLPDGSIPSLGNVTQASRMSRTTQFVKPAEGMAAKYSTDMREILRESYTEAVGKAALRDLYNTAEAKEVAQPSSQFVPDRAAGPNAGKWVKAVQFQGLHPSLQHDLNMIAQRKNTAPAGGVQRVLQAYQRGATRLQLGLNPFELANHMRRQLHVVASKPPVGMGVLARLEAVVPFFGPKVGTFKRAMSDMSTPARQKILLDITRQGGGSTRAFGEKYGVIQKVPGAKQVSEFTNKLLFSVPKGRGIMGWDLRMRILLEEMRRNAEPSLANDKQRMRQFANQIGQYGSMKSWAVQALQHVNPYAATSLPMRGAELKTLFADPGFKPESVSKSTLHRMETFMRGTGGTILMLALANKQLSGHWPWENGKGHEFDLDTGVKDKDGNPIYINSRFLAPEFYRAIKTMSIPELLTEVKAAHSSDNPNFSPDYLSAASMGPANAATSLVFGSPAVGITSAAVAQRAPYWVRDPGQHGMDLMPVGQLTAKQKEAGVSPYIARAEGVAEQVHPFINALIGYMDEPIKGLRPLGAISVGREDHSGAFGFSNRGSSRGRSSRGGGRGGRGGR